MRQPNFENLAVSTHIPAPGGIRIAAFIVDIVTVGILTSFANALQVPATFNSWISILYFVACHGTTGQTLGKYMFGLRVVGTNGEKPSNGHLLLRETIGRFASTIVLFIGYIRALSADDARGWHDMMSGTSVICTRAQSRTRSTFSFGQIAMLAGGGVVCLVGLMIYALFFTALPLQDLARKAELQGVEIEGLKGSLARGVTIDKLSYKAEEGEIELSDINIAYDLFKVYKDDHLLINNISVSSGRIKTKPYTELAAGLQQPEEKPSQVTDEKPKQGLGLGSLTIERIDIANVVLEGPTATPFNLQRFYVDNLAVKEGKLTLDQIWIQSDALDLNVGGILLSKQNFAMNKLMQGTIKTALAPKHLVRDVKFETSLKGNIQAKDIQKLYVGLFDRRIQISKKGNDFSVQTYGFTPAHHIKNSPPLANISVGAKGTSFFALMVPSSGSFNLRSIPFKNELGATYSYQRGDRIFRMRLNWNDLITVKENANLAIVTNEHDSKEEWLSDIYFAKRFAELTSEQQTAIQSDAVHFNQLMPRQSAPMPTLADSGAWQSRTIASAVSDEERAARRRQTLERLCQSDQKNCENYKRMFNQER